uniref:Spore protein YkvP/CgeB glycosyl transferase-like domain-containing protein n=1 Tax=Desulfovibrio sp. U5L TaxID=596152 RepID=I2Q2L5_9BACT
MARIVLIYDVLLRPDTTGKFCRAALSRLGHEAIHYAPLSLESGGLRFNNYAGLPAGADLYLQIDDDIAYPAPEIAGKKAYWCIDVHRMDDMVGGMTRLEKMRGFDMVFSAQKDMATKLGVPWLPLACDERIWRLQPKAENRYDWCFVGNLHTPERRALFARLAERFPRCFVGNAYGREQNTIYNGSTLILNLTVGNDVNMRFFEAQAAGGSLVSNRPGNGEDELFSHILYYDACDTLISLMAELLADRRRVKTIGYNQWQETTSRHTYAVRMQKLLELCGS